MRSEGHPFLPIEDGEGNHARVPAKVVLWRVPVEHGGGVTAVTPEVPARTADTGAIYPSTTLRVVPLPIASNGEE